MFVVLIYCVFNFFVVYIVALWDEILEETHFSTLHHMYMYVTNKESQPLKKNSVVRKETLSYLCHVAKT